MTLSRRTLIKLGLGAGATPLLYAAPLRAVAAESTESRSPLTERFLRAHPIPLTRVRLTGGPLKHAQERDIQYLLALEPDRMLAYYRERAGLPPKAKPYGGWDGDGRNLTGHVAGHYLSAISLMWAATGDRRFKDRADYIVQELKVVQDKHGDGYLCALKGGRDCFNALARGEIRSAAFDLNGEWSPWYTLHKTFAGLRDAYRYTGNRTALDVETKFAAWAERILAGLTDEQIQHMLNTEFGGMNEVLVDLYADTGDPRWLALSYKFEHRAIVDPLKRHQDDLGGTHANTQIPKLIGSAHRFVYTGEPADLLAAGFFWDTVTQHHSFSTGGHGTDEYFGPPDLIGARVDGRTAESCNVYNMLKLARLLFATWPDVHYADFQERALFNHALASMDPQDGRMCYMVPVGQGVTHEYQEMFEAFTCCMGTGMENHALHGEGIYFFEGGDRLWWNIYAPSTAEWPEAGARLTLETDFPEGEKATLKLSLKSPRTFTLAVRRPYWVGEGFSVTVNGEPVTEQERGPEGAGRGAPRRRGESPALPPVGSYVEVRRTWKSGDVVEVSLPKTLRLEPTPDDPRRAAILWGPLVLAGDLGPEPERGRGRRERPGRPVVPVLVAAEQPVEAWLEPVPGEPGHFRTRGAGREPNAEGRAHEVDLVPFYRLHRRTYAVYWDFFTEAEWEKQKAEYAREEARQRQLEAASVSFVQPGDEDSERAAGYEGAPDAHPQFMRGRVGRAARTWFAYRMAVDPTHPMALVVTYYTADRRTAPASFEILVDGQRVAEQEVQRTDPGRFFDVSYPIPADLVRGKSSVTVRFQAKERSQIAAIYDVRVIRADQAGDQGRS